MTRRAGDRERGSTMVEFALVSVVAFTMLFGMTDAAMIVLGNSVGSNAARDGARTGIVNFHQADVVGSATRTNIEASVRRRLSGNVKDVTVTVRCKSPNLSITKSCVDYAIDVGRDMLEVQVQWKHMGSAPLMPVTTHTAVSRMVISGPPSP